MFTFRLATAPDPSPVSGVLQVEVEGLGSQISLPMPPPGFAKIWQPLPAPDPTATFTIKIYYYLDQQRVGVVVNGVGGDDSINIFASRLDPPAVPFPGVLYVGNVIHSGLQTEGHDCSVHCENGTPKIEDCCVVCRDGNIVTETCC
jgi:hypothetical protein